MDGHGIPEAYAQEEVANLRRIYNASPKASSPPPRHPLMIYYITIFKLNYVNKPSYERPSLGTVRTHSAPGDMEDLAPAN